MPELDVQEQVDARTNGRSAEPHRVSRDRSWSLWEGVSEWYLWGPALFVAIGVLIPLVYLVIRAFEAEPAYLAELILRPRTLWLLWNTVALTVGVLVVATAIAFPLAWLLRGPTCVGNGSSRCSPCCRSPCRGM